MATFSQTRWSLNDLLDAPDSPRFNDYQSQLAELLNEFEAARAILSPDIPIPEFVRVLDTYEAINKARQHLVGYGMLWFTEDTQKQEALIYKARMDQLAADVQNRTLFFSLWFKSLDDAQADRLIAASGDRRYYLEATRHFKPYTLSEAEEQLINIKDVNGIGALVASRSLWPSASGSLRAPDTLDPPDPTVTALHVAEMPMPTEPSVAAGGSLRASRPRSRWINNTFPAFCHGPIVQLHASANAKESCDCRVPGSPRRDPTHRTVRSTGKQYGPQNLIALSTG